MQNSSELYSITSLGLGYASFLKVFPTTRKAKRKTTRRLWNIYEALTEHFQLKKKLAKSSSPPNPGERINNFVTRLQTLADHCDYNDEKDNQIRDRTLTFIKDKHLKVKLYRDNDLTLGKLLDIVTTYHDKEALVLVPAFEGLLGKLKGFQLKLHIDQSCFATITWNSFQLQAKSQ